MKMGHNFNALIISEMIAHGDFFMLLDSRKLICEFNF